MGSRENLCHDIYPAGPITTVSLAANTCCMIDSLSSHAPGTMSRSSLAALVHRAIND